MAAAFRFGAELLEADELEGSPVKSILCNELVEANELDIDNWRGGATAATGALRGRNLLMKVEATGAAAGAGAETVAETCAGIGAETVAETCVGAGAWAFVTRAGGAVALL